MTLVGLMLLALQVHDVHCTMLEVRFTGCVDPVCHEVLVNEGCRRR